MTASSKLKADLFVLAAGIWSHDLCCGLGLRLPLDAERRYHVTLPEQGIKIYSPVVLADMKFEVTPMHYGLRLAGTIEFGDISAPPTQKRYDLLLASARRVLQGLKTDGATRWMGCRPSFPDSLPVIDRSPKQQNMLLAFGRGHLGLTSAGVTGKAIADLAAGRDTDFDLTPFRADRF